MEQYDLIVIGAGPAGEKGAARAAFFGKRVCIVERAPKPGGAAVNTGTLPSKSLRETALYFSGLRQHGLYGVDFRVKNDIGIGDFMFRERAVIESQWKLIDENLNRNGVTQIQGAARFINPKTIEITRLGTTPRRLSADYFLLATGSQPQQPDTGRVDGEVIVDSESLLTLQKIPSTMIVVGAGAVGCEYACIFAALGVRVTLLTERPRVLAHLDPEISDLLRQQMTGRLGISVQLETQVTSLTAENGRAVARLAADRELTAECALFAAGRVGATSGLGLDDIGVKTNARGFVVTDEHYRTSCPDIYAAGDVIGFPALASTSMEQARTAVAHAFDLRYKPASANVQPYSVYTIPEISTVGMTEDELDRLGVSYEIGRSSYRTNPRGMMIGETEGIIKLLFCTSSQRLLGASIVGENASELIHVAMACIASEGTLDFFIESVFAYPSLADAYKYAAYNGLQALARRHGRDPSLPSGAFPIVTK